MKTTVRIGKNRRIVVQPMAEGVQMMAEVRHTPGADLWTSIILLNLTPDEAGALMFGIEQALEVGKFAAMRATVACPHARICDQEGECVNGCTQRLGAPA